jgi:hypothetical protein
MKIYLVKKIKKFFFILLIADTLSMLPVVLFAFAYDNKWKYICDFLTLNEPTNTLINIRVYDTLFYNLSGLSGLFGMFILYIYSTILIFLNFIFCYKIKSITKYLISIIIISFVNFLFSCVCFLAFVGVH